MTDPVCLGIASDVVDGLVPATTLWDWLDDNGFVG